MRLQSVFYHLLEDSLTLCAQKLQCCRFLFFFLYLCCCSHCPSVLSKESKGIQELKFLFRASFSNLFFLFLDEFHRKPSKGHKIPLVVSIISLLVYMCMLMFHWVWTVWLLQDENCRVHFDLDPIPCINVFKCIVHRKVVLNSLTNFGGDKFIMCKWQGLAYILFSYLLSD